MDPDIIRQLLQNPDFLRQTYQETEQTVGQSAPTLPIPSIQVPADVELKGTLDLHITFPWSSIQHLDTQTIHQRVMDVVMGAEGPWLPRVYPGELKLWQEEKTDEHREPQQRRPNLIRTDRSYTGDIPGLGNKDDEGRTGSTVFREDTGPPEWEDDSQG